MDFKLFGRLKDDGGGEQNSSNGRNNSGQSQSMDQIGGGNVDRTVSSMFDQGYSEEEIRSELQGQYSSDQINRAINNAVTSSATSGNSNQGGPEPMSPYQGDEEAVSPMDEGYDNNDNQNPQENQQQNPAPQQQQAPAQNQANQQAQQSLMQDQGGEVDPRVEELIETIIAENFQKVEKEFQNVYSELDMIEDKLADMEDRLHDLEIRDDEDQKEFINKMEEVEEHIDSYESRIGGLEKAFQQMLPSLVDNIRELTSLVQEIKQEQGIETESSVSSQEVEDIDMDAFKK